MNFFISIYLKDKIQIRCHKKCSKCQKKLFKNLIHVFSKINNKMKIRCLFFKIYWRKKLAQPFGTVPFSRNFKNLKIYLYFIFRLILTHFLLKMELIVPKAWAKFITSIKFEKQTSNFHYVIYFTKKHESTCL